MQHEMYHAARAAEAFLCCMDASTQGDKAGQQVAEDAYTKKVNSQAHKMVQDAR